MVGIPEDLPRFLWAKPWRCKGLHSITGHVCYPKVNLQKNVETHGFPRKIIYKRYQKVGFTHLCKFTEG